MKSKALIIDVEKKETEVKEIENKEIIGPMDWGVYNHLKVYESYKYSPFNENNVVTFGIGKFAGGILPGTHRLIFMFRSPLWTGLFVSALGGAGYSFIKTGLDFVTIKGKSKKPAIILIRGINDEVNVDFKEIDINDLLDIYKGYKGKKGVFALELYVVEKFGKYFEGNNFRPIVVGPAAINTNYGAIYSATVLRGKVDWGSEGWAARGGGGSVLYQAHHVVAVLFGGSNKKEVPDVLRDRKKLDEIFESKLSKPMVRAIMDSTTKYRYDPKVSTGGTFGVNFETLREHLLVFNWNTIYMPFEERIRIWKEYVKDHYLKQFNDETIKNKTWKTCGEPCPVTCKKVWDDYEKDYEPYEANGPNAGIFDNRAAEEAASTVDAMGFDAIYFGNVATWIMEAIYRGLLKPADLGINIQPHFDYKNYKLEYSFENAKFIKELAIKVAFGEGEIAKKLGMGIRRAAKALSGLFKEREEMIGIKFKDLSAYVPFGKEGDIIPTMYWAPGNFAPIPIQGKYFTHYHVDFKDPKTLADLAFDRAVKEFISENGGLCRFHRRWAEKVFAVLYKSAFGEVIDLEEHNKKLLQQIVEYDKKAEVKPVFWESERVINIIAKAAEEFKDEAWIKKFKENKLNAAREYWNIFLNEYENLLGIKW